jgi:hypothetical protein
MQTRHLSSGVAIAVLVVNEPIGVTIRLVAPVLGHTGPFAAAQLPFQNAGSRAK